jgi:class 3 adenylate cyclase
MRILKAAANLVGETTDSEVREATPDAPQASPSPISPGEAERRQLTVMFCDLVGSTALSEQLDAEEYRELISVYQFAARQAIESFDGYIARYMGDGLLVYFGYPRAHEDDAERAVRAGLAIIAHVAALKTSPEHELAVRIGIATGLVIAGDIVGEGAAEEHAVLGETPNLAARLQASAEPGVVIIANQTQQLIHGVFECIDRGMNTYKGFSKPLRSWSVYAERPNESRFEARRGQQQVALVGRDSELSLLLDRWEQARDGDGQVVLLCGEAGIGKSRLTQALREQVSAQAHRVLRYQCSPYHSQSAFYPIITALERELSFSTEDDDQDKVSKLEAM